MAKINDNGAAEQPLQAEPSKLMPRAVLALADALGVMESPLIIDLVPPDGEHEIDYVARTLPLVGQAGKARIVALEGDLKAVRRQLASQRGATTKARGRIIELEEAGKPRAIGAMAAVFDDDGEKQAAMTELMTAIDGAHEIVLAFSDGAAELRGIKPRQVRAEAFRWTRGRLLFTDEPLEVTGPGGEDSVTTLAGVALLVDGEQVDWSPLPMPIRIGAGQTINLAGSVIFG